jgi:hypothetical protein
MSAIGPRRTSASALRMSAFGRKADMRFCTANVCFWPKADMGLISFDLLCAISHTPINSDLL